MAIAGNELLPDAVGFLQQIRDHPDDDGPRLIYADWLDEQGDPRGAFVRVQLALARLLEDDPRRGELVRQEHDFLARYAHEWAIPFRGIAAGPVFRRGLIEEVNVTARQFLTHPDALFAAAPVRHIHLLDVGTHLHEVLASPHLTRLTGLTIFAQHFDPKLARTAARAIAEARHLTRLKVLRLGRNRFGDAGAAFLAGSPHLGGLQEFDLRENDVGEAGAVALAESAQLGGLRRLEFGNNAVGPVGAEAVAGSERRPTLDRLGLAGNRIGGRRLHHLTRPGTLLRVAALNLTDNGLGLAGLAILLAGLSEDTAGVHDLNLCQNDLGDGGVRALAECPGLAGLKTLRLTGNGVTNEGLKALAGSTHLAGLTGLDVSNNPVADDGFKALLGSPYLRGLRRLVYPGIGLSMRMRAALDARYNRGAVASW